MEKALQFISELKENNNREWFHANKSRYNEAKEHFLTQIQDIIDRVQLSDARLSGLLAKDAMFRIYRDIRFSNDKTPYKTHFSAYMAKGGKKSIEAGYYIQLSNDQCFIGGGVYNPPKEELKVIRQEILYQAETFIKLLEEKKSFGFKLSDHDKLKNGPKDFPKDSPHLELIKNKHFLFSKELSTKEIKSGDFTKIVSGHFEKLFSFTDFLNTAMEFKGNE